ncbi:MAG TPA: hypothetical protein VGR37_17430 [Longimicrobiaceae bacterium]|nr:hypothetical protein [Longimicrobiaceae bacterium]
MTKRSRLLICLLYLPAGAGCSGPHQEPPAESLQLTKLEPIHLVETDSLYVGKPAALALDPDNGNLYVSDGFWGRVLAFSPSGTLDRVYGKRGEGPGEISDPGAVAVHNGELLVADVGGQRFVRYDRATGEFNGGVRFDGVLTSMQPHGNKVWLGIQNRPRRTSLGVWSPEASSIRYLGELPGEFLESEPLAGIYNGIQVVEWSDTVLAGFMGLNRLVRLRADGSTIDTLPIPVRKRRGEMKNIVKRLGGMEFPEMFSANSALFRLHRLPSGSFAAVHYDQTISGDLITANVYLSILSGDFKTTCPDHAIEVAADAQPYTAFRGDTLFVLQQKVEGQRASAFVDRYVIGEAACPSIGRA